MDQNHLQPPGQPIIAKYVESSGNEIESLTLSRYAIGYILSGEKHIFYGDKSQTIARGDLFYLGTGRHYVQNLAADGRPFEQIVFYYTSSELQQILQHLNLEYGLEVANHHRCDRCRCFDHVAVAASSAVRNLFLFANSFLREEPRPQGDTNDRLLRTELIYLILTREDDCLRSKLLSNVDSVRDNFRQTIQEHIFRDVSISELSTLTHRSLTSFKKEFRRLFGMPPHKWFIGQRLIHARLLLISTDLSISEIGNECSFPNTSHFIKLYKKEYGLTPAAYRSRYRRDEVPMAASAGAGSPATTSLEESATPLNPSDNRPVVAAVAAGEELREEWPAPSRAERIAL